MTLLLLLLLLLFVYMLLSLLLWLCFLFVSNLCDLQSTTARIVGPWLPHSSFAPSAALLEWRFCRHPCWQVLTLVRLRPTQSCSTNLLVPSRRLGDVKALRSRLPLHLRPGPLVCRLPLRTLRRIAPLLPIGRPVRAPSALGLTSLGRSCQY